MHVVLPDGSDKELPDGASGADLAAAIGAGPGARGARRRRSTARCATSRVRSTTARRSTIVTSRDPESLELIRHDTAHVLAAAILDLYPGTKISIGPPIEDGFYYDFEFPDGVTVSEHDFEAIEAEMREHVKADEVFEREDVTPGAAMERFTREGQDYKVELIEDLVTRHRGPDRLALHQRAVHRPLPRAARALDQAHPRVQAAQRGRRLLARRREPPDAHARLRHRLPLQGGARRRTSSASSRPAPATIASWAASSSCSCSPSSRPDRRSGSPTAWSSGTR